MYKHPTALVETDEIGSGSKIYAFAHVMAGARVGEECNIGDHAFIEGGAIIGNRVTVKNLVMIWDGVVLEDDVFVGPNVVFTNDLRPRSPRASIAADRYRDRRWLTRTVVETGASIGSNSTILSGLTVGRYSMIGAGAVVTRNVPPHALMMGIPARQTGWVSETGATLSFINGTARCPVSGKVWTMAGDRIVCVRDE